MDTYETTAKHNLAETCCASISIDELLALSEDKTATASSLLATSTIQGYGEIPGSSELRNNLSRLYSTKVGTPLKPENILITAGAIAANHLALYALVGKGDHVICHYPTYQQLYSIPGTLGAEVDLWRSREEDSWLPDFAELEKLIKPNTKLIILKCVFQSQSDQRRNVTRYPIAPEKIRKTHNSTNTDSTQQPSKPHRRHPAQTAPRKNNRPRHQQIHPHPLRRSLPPALPRHLTLIPRLPALDPLTGVQQHHRHGLALQSLLLGRHPHWLDRVPECGDGGEDSEGEALHDHFCESARSGCGEFCVGSVDNTRASGSQHRSRKNEPGVA